VLGNLGSKLQGLLNLLVGLSLPFEVHIKVVIRPERQRHTPVRHGSFRIEFCGAPE